MNAKEKAIKEHNEDKNHPNWKETCKVCIENAIKEVFDDIEKEFNVDHFCQDHNEWCDCWKKFKTKQLGGRE